MNTSKLLPPSKYTSTADRMAAAYDKKVDDVLSFKVKEKAIKVDKLLKNQLIQDKKRKKKKDIKKEQEKFNLRETLLETKKLTKGMRGIKLPSIPKMSFLDSIRNFITFTLLGIVANQLFKYLPQFTDITKKMIGIIGTVGGFFEGIAKELLNGFATFIHEGYKLRDGFKDFIGKKFGDNAAKQFEELEKKLNLFFDLSLLTGLLSLDIAMDLNRDRKGTGKIGAAAAGVGAGGRPLTPEELKKLGLKPGSVEARAIQRPGTKAQRESAKQQKRIQGAEIRAQSKKPNLTGPFAKFAGPLGKFLKVAVPGVGAALGALDSKARFAAGDNLGGSIAAASSALDAFVALGAGLTLAGVASVVGIPVAALTGTAATIAAGLSMALDVILLVRDVLEVMGIKLPGFGGYSFAQGGEITRGGKPVSGQITRTVKPVERKEIPVKPQKSQPGKDVGGRKEIQKLFSDPMSPTGPDAKSDPDAINPLRTLETTSKILKTIPFLGGVMGSAVDISMGERPNKQIFKSFGGAVGSLIQDVADNQISLSLSDVSKSISAMANGGQVKSANLLKENNIGYQIGSLVAKVFEGMIDSRVNEIFQELKKQFKKSEEDTGPIGEGGSAPEARLRSGSNAEIEADLLEYFTAIYGKNAAIGIVANIRRESGYRTSTPENPRFEGMVQWSRNDRWPKFVKWAESKGLDPYNRNVQAQYVAIDINNHGIAGELKAASSPEEAASIFYNKFERGIHSKAYLGNAYDPDNPHENLNKQFISEITGRNPNIGKRISQVVVSPAASMSGYSPRTPGLFNAIQYITGDPSQGANYDLAGHGTRDNYHDHIAFATEADKERAKAALRAAGIEIGDEYRPGPGYHGKNLAIDIPGAQWKGSGAIGQREYSGSAKVRRVLGLKDGGVIGPSIPKNIAPIKTYASYDSESQVIMMIQPVHYYTNTSKKSVSFPGVVVNNNSSRSNSTFFRQ